jgi:hypothetical protein
VTRRRLFASPKKQHQNIYSSNSMAAAPSAKETYTTKVIVVGDAATGMLYALEDYLVACRGNLVAFFSPCGCQAKPV